jgi:hypothetical protein
LVGADRGHAYYFAVTDEVPDARAAGMGRAFTAVAEGSSGTWWNPGGLGLVRGWSAMPFSQAPRRGGFESQVYRVRAFGLAGSVGPGGVGIHYGRKSGDGVYASSHDYHESVLALGYGVDLLGAIRGRHDDRLQWGIGASAKRYAEHQPNAANPELVDISAWDADLGTLVRWERPLEGLPRIAILADGAASRPSFVAGRFGLMYKNVLDRKIGPNDAPLGREIRGGLRIEAGLVSAAKFGHLLRTVATVEVDHSPTDPETSDNVRFGLEATLLGMLTWRYGEFDDHYVLWVHNDQGVRRYARNARGVTQGLGLRFGDERLALRCDYARTRQGEGETKLFSLSFGRGL